MSSGSSDGYFLSDTMGRVKPTGSTLGVPTSFGGAKLVFVLLPQQSFGVDLLGRRLCPRGRDGEVRPGLGLDETLSITKCHIKVLFLFKVQAEVQVQILIIAYFLCFIKFIR